MEHTIVVVVCGLVLVAASNALERRIPVPAPVIQTLIGIVLAFIPGIPSVHLNPDFVLLVLLPPLVYAAAVALPWDEFISNFRPIAALAFGLVFATVATVAVVAHSIIPGMPLAAALALGAVVSPTDPVASTAVASRVGVPRRLSSILEGEGLINDAVGLTVKTIAVSALLGHELSVTAGLARFLFIVVGEISYGLAVGWAIAAVRKRIDDPNTETIVTLVTPFAAYLPPAALGGSGVLATVATGMYIGERRSEFVPSGIRLRLTSVWTLVVNILNGILFLLTGLQARSIWGDTGHAPGHLLRYTSLIVLAVILLRFGWTFGLEWLGRMLLPHALRTGPRHSTFIAWSGMRGAISLAAALSIPIGFASRPAIVFITAGVIAATLLMQGTTLPWLVRMLRLDRDAAVERETQQQREAEARAEVARAAVAALEGDHDSIRILEHVRRDYELMIQAAEDENTTRELESEARIRRHAIAAQRRRAIDMHRNHEISDEILHRIERDLDLQEAAAENKVPETQ